MGLLRLYLAISVIIGHAKQPIGNFWGIGAFYAVNLFFIISGFYMTLVLNEKYIGNKHNLDFIKNRLLRIYPTYYIGALLGLTSLYITGKIQTIINILSSSNIGVTLYIVISNLFIIGQDLPYIFRVGPINSYGNGFSAIDMSLNPPSWSIAVEIMFYLIAPLILRSKKRTILFFLFGALYSISLKYIMYPINYHPLINSTTDLIKMQYYFFPSSIIFFALGGLIYHYIYLKLHKEENNSVRTYIYGVIILLIITQTTSLIHWYELVFYIFAIPALFIFTKSNKVDRVIGELSYSTYLFHYPILLIVNKYSPFYLWQYKISNIYVVTLFTLVLSVLVYIFVEKPISKYRSHLISNA